MNAISSSRPVSDTVNGAAGRLGMVSLVGAGPGAADLLTIRAAKTLEAADVVYYDSLVDESVLAYVRPEAKTVFVGKRKGFCAMPQQEIQDKMRNDAFAGRRVVRLKGGDPYIFGRGGEEAIDLRAYGISVDVVPGVTAALAAAAETDIPLTQRDVATSVTFVTGHTLDGSIPDLDGLLTSKRTLVVYMGISNAGVIVNQLREQSVPGSMPVAVVENASLPNQRHIRTTLDALEADLVAHQMGTPALLVLGNVAALCSEDSKAVKQVSSNPEPGPSFAWVHHPMG